MSEYKRATQKIELPSGKQVEIVTYFSAWEIEEIRKILSGDLKLSAKSAESMQANNTAEEFEFSMNDLTEATRKARTMAVKKLIDSDEAKTEYEPTEENLNNFVDSVDGKVLDAAINEMTKKN